MHNWILQLVLRHTGPILSLARDVARRLSTIWSTITRFFGRLRKAWSLLYTRARALATNLRNAFIEAYNTLRWIIFVLVPRALRQLRTSLMLWATRLIIRVERLARGLVAAARDWAARQVRDIRAWITRTIRWAEREVYELWRDLRRTMALVFSLLTSPARFARWAAGAMTTAILRYLDSRRDAIGRWLLRRSVAFTLWLARTIDDVIGRIM